MPSHLRSTCGHVWDLADEASNQLIRTGRKYAVSGSMKHAKNRTFLPLAKQSFHRGEPVEASRT